MSEGPSSPFEALGALAAQEVEVTDSLRHVEVYTVGGLLTMLWHGDPEVEHVVLACGGAMGGLLGPAEGLYHDLGVRFGEQGIGLVRVGYRKPNDLGACVHDLVAVAELAARRGARRFVTMGHSFGGAVAVRAAITLGDDAAGVVTLATQSAGCEDAERLAETPVLRDADRRTSGRSQQAQSPNGSRPATAGSSRARFSVRPDRCDPPTSRRGYS